MSAGGFVVIPNWVHRTDRLNIWEVAVYTSLLNRADSRGMCFPSMALLARDAKVSITTVRKYLAHLVELDLVTVTARVSPSNHRVQTSNLYYVTTDEPDSEGWSASRRGVLRDAQGGTTRGAHEDRPSEVNPGKGARASATPAPLEKPSRFCRKHPTGAAGACGSCGDARRAAEQWEVDDQARMAVEATEVLRRSSWIQAQPECPHGIAGGGIDRPGVGTPGCSTCRSIKKGNEAAA